MPKFLTGSAGTFPAQTAPLASEPRTAGSVEAAMQNAADRTQYLYDRLMYLDPARAGARRLRTFTTEAALKASTDYQDGTVAAVGERAIYRYDASSALAPASPWTLRPDDNPAGNGRWRVLAAGVGLFGAENGIPTLDASGKIPTSSLAASGGGARILQTSLATGRVVDTMIDGSAIATSVAAGVSAIVAGLSVSASAQVGDRLVYMAQIETLTALSDAVGARIRMTKPDASTVYGGRSQHQPTDAREQRMAHGLMFSTIAAATGTYVFDVEIEAHVTNASNVAASLGFARLEAVRP
jgi:hypothetical protein